MAKPIISENLSNLTLLSTTEPKFNFKIVVHGTTTQPFFEDAPSSPHVYQAYGYFKTFNVESTLQDAMHYADNLCGLEIITYPTCDERYEDPAEEIVGDKLFPTRVEIESVKYTKLVMSGSVTGDKNINWKCDSSAPLICRRVLNQHQNSNSKTAA
jgi:hypothetical protein